MERGTGNATKERVGAGVGSSRGLGGKERSEGGRSARRGAHQSPITSPPWERKGMKETWGEMKKKGKMAICP
uniref:Uncharacterized protein n=1 Tax=Oryza barthii TaxID=65489 RepID=A0A0D3F4P2_9ORYZ